MPKIRVTVFLTHKVQGRSLFVTREIRFVHLRDVGGASGVGGGRQLPLVSSILSPTPSYLQVVRMTVRSTAFNSCKANPIFVKKF